MVYCSFLQVSVSDKIWPQNRSGTAMLLNSIFYKSVPALVMICLLFALPLQTPTAAEEKMAVVVSRKIKPYMQILTGLRQGLEEETAPGTDIYFLSGADTDTLQILAKIKNTSPCLLLAIGPEAGRIIWSMDTSIPRFFTAILAPHKVPGIGPSACGISLQIPIETQLNVIAKNLPHTRSIGLLFDARYNESFFQTARISGQRHGITIIPFNVNTKKDIPRVLKEKVPAIDCLWMIPDPTVISKKIVQYVIKALLYHKKGVIGYNAFFLKSGAVLSFEFDYQEIGLQTAQALLEHPQTPPCRNHPPRFHIFQNPGVAKKLNIQLKGGGE